MGGLGKKMRITQITFLIGCLAIAGIPGFSGFFSKDEILTAAFAHNPILYYIGLGGALMTAFYMFRLYAMYFKEAIEQQPIIVTPIFKGMLIVISAIIILLGIFPQWLISKMYF